MMTAGTPAPPSEHEALAAALRFLAPWQAARVLALPANKRAGALKDAVGTCAGAHNHRAVIDTTAKGVRVTTDAAWCAGWDDSDPDRPTLRHDRIPYVVVTWQTLAVHCAAAWRNAPGAADRYRHGSDLYHWLHEPENDRNAVDHPDEYDGWFAQYCAAVDEQRDAWADALATLALEVPSTLDVDAPAAADTPAREQLTDHEADGRLFEPARYDARPTLFDPEEPERVHPHVLDTLPL